MSNWFKNAVIYQIYPQSFLDTNADGIGDINGITQKLDYLKELGVDALWICPMYDSPNHDNGYDVRNYYKLQDRYGSNDDFDTLVAQAHKRGIRIIMDLVLNHTSNESPWFQESASSKNNKKGDWYIWRDGKPNGEPPTNWGAIFGGSAWTYCPERGQYYLHTFSPYQPDLNWESTEMKNALFEMVRWWIDRGVDGFRLDAINFLAKDLSFPDGPTENRQYADIYPFVANRPKVHQYLAELKHEALYDGKVLTVGEASSATVADALSFANELDMIFQFEHVALDISPTIPWGAKPIDIVELKQCLNKWQTQLHNRAWNSLFWENHDQPRIVNRLGSEDTHREKSAKMLAVCMYFLEGTPFVYQGQELGTPNTKFYFKSETRDIEVQNAFAQLVDSGYYTEDELLKKLSRRCRDTARTPMLWNSSEYAGFSTVQPWIKINECYPQINVHEQEAREDSCLNFYKKLFRLRKTLNEVTNGEFVLLDKQDVNTFSYLRKTDHGTIAVVCNLRPYTVPFPSDQLYADAEILLSNTEHTSLQGRNALDAFDAYVFRIV